MIADALLRVPEGRRVHPGEAIASRDGIDLVCRNVSDGDAGPHAVTVRFVVKDARYDPGVRYAIHTAHAGYGCG